MPVEVARYFSPAGLQRSVPKALSVICARPEAAPKLCAKGKGRAPEAPSGFWKSALARIWELFCPYSGNAHRTGEKLIRTATRASCRMLVDFDGFRLVAFLPPDDA
jgi:hypothetical protein